MSRFAVFIRRTKREPWFHPMLLESLLKTIMYLILFNFKTILSIWCLISIVSALLPTTTYQIAWHVRVSDTWHQHYPLGSLTCLTIGEVITLNSQFYCHSMWRLKMPGNKKINRNQSLIMTPSQNKPGEASNSSTLRAKSP